MSALVELSEAVRPGRSRKGRTSSGEMIRKSSLRSPGSAQLLRAISTAPPPIRRISAASVPEPPVRCRKPSETRRKRRRTTVAALSAGAGLPFPGRHRARDAAVPNSAKPRGWRGNSGGCTSLFPSFPMGCGILWLARKKWIDASHSAFAQGFPLFRLPRVTRVEHALCVYRGAGALERPGTIVAALCARAAHEVAGKS